MRVQLLTDSPIPPPSSGDRTPGIHISRVIASIASEAGILKKGMGPAAAPDLVEWGGFDSDWWKALSAGDQLRISIGLAWEQYYLSLLPNVLVHPGELQVEGIYLTPDGESLDYVLSESHAGFLLAGHECKATYKSTNTVGNLEGPGAWMWVTQMMAYAKAMGCLRFFLHVLFLCGDYKYPITPQLRIFEVNFTQAEIDERWSMLTTYVRHRQNQEAEDAFRDTEDAR